MKDRTTKKGGRKICSFPRKCNDDRVIKTGLDAITEFRRAGVGVIAFACCFVKGTLVISFGYDIPYPENMQTAMVMWVIERLPEEEKYKKVEYYPADKFDAECGKHCKHL